MHPLTALFGALQMGTAQGMVYLADRGGILSDLWERYPEPEEVTWREIVHCFELAKTINRVHPAWCDAWIRSVHERIFDLIEGGA